MLTWQTFAGIEVVIAVLVAAITLIYLFSSFNTSIVATFSSNMSGPVEESLDVSANCTSNELVVACAGHQRNAQVAPSNNYLLHLLLSFFSNYVALYLLICNVQMPEDISVQEPIQCTNTGNGVSVIRGKDYPPPAN